MELDSIHGNNDSLNKKNSLMSLENHSGGGFVLRIGSKTPALKDDHQMSLSLENLKEEFPIGGGMEGFTPNQDISLENFGEKKVQNNFDFGGFNNILKNGKRPLFS